MLPYTRDWLRCFYRPKGRKPIWDSSTKNQPTGSFLTDITGQIQVIPAKCIISRQELEHPMLPERLAHARSYEEFDSLVCFLVEQNYGIRE